VHQVGDQPRLYYDARSTNHQDTLMRFHHRPLSVPGSSIFPSVFRLTFYLRFTSVVIELSCYTENGCNVASGPKHRIFSLKKDIPCRLVGRLKRFGGTWGLDVQGMIYLLSHYKMWMFIFFIENMLRMENITTSKIPKIVVIRRNWFWNLVFLSKLRMAFVHEYYTYVLGNQFLGWKWNVYVNII